MQRIKGRILDYCLYVGISLIVVASIFVANVLKVPPSEFIGWFGLLCMTFIVFGFGLPDKKRFWQERSLLILMGVVFVAHCDVLIWWGEEIITWSVTKKAFAFAIELCLIEFLKRLMLRRSKQLAKTEQMTFPSENQLSDERASKGAEEETLRGTGNY